MAGRPLKFKTPQELEKAMDVYFNKTPFGEYTVTGLALVIGSKQLLSDYEEREGYGEIVRMARLRVENSYEISLRKDGGSNNIFALKNFGWNDKQEIEHNGSAISLTFENKSKDGINYITGEANKQTKRNTNTT